VGKTAIVEGLAQRIVEGKSLKGKRIIELNLARIVAGTTYRGQLEERVVQIVDEARSAPNLILFLDEIHALVGAGSAAGGLDVSHILKPALARGEISCIGATTLAEYRRHIETDSALERRFQPVKVVEPTSSEALAMLEGMRPRLQEHHRVTILPEALKAAVDLSVRYIHDRRLPDKALDLIDRACARASTPGLTVVIRDDPNGEGPEVTPILVAEVVSEWADVPVPELASRDGSYLLRIEESLKRRVVGQDDAVGRVAARLQRARAGVGSPNRPAGVFLFIGPSGVGKTELAKALAGALFGSVERMIRIDLSEFQEPHSVSKLIGSPPGYVGYDEEGQLTGRLRTQPHSVVLLDEVEKAHGNVFDLFLQLFDEGRLTDAKGRTAVATSAVFIMTSNLMPPARMGFERESTAEYRAAVISEVRKQFRPEFLNRIDEIVLFRQLGAEDVAEIARRRIAELAERLSSSHGVFLSAEDDALALLADEGLDPASGARGLARVIALRVEEPLSKLILSGDLSRGRSAVLRSTGGGIEVLVSGVEGGERAERGRVPHDRD
jgi:ATP-dependent Clp protease ATP-binding subunit ClpC